MPEWLSRTSLIQLFQYTIGLVLLVWLLQQVDWNRISVLFTRMSISTVVAVLVISILGLIARFFTWHTLLTSFHSTDLSTSANIDLIINFINQLLPSRVSGRSLSPLVIRQMSGISWSDAIAVTGINTGLYAILYGIIAIIGFIFAYPHLEPGVNFLVLLSVMIYFAVGIAILILGTRPELVATLAEKFEFITRRIPIIGDRLTKLLDRLPDFTEESGASFEQLLYNSRTVLGYILAWGGALLIAPGIRVWLLLSTFGAGIETTVLLPVFLVTAYSVTLLPISPGGIGVTEVTATLVFVALGIPEEVIVPVIITDRFLGTYLPALSGGIPASRINLVEQIN